MFVAIIYFAVISAIYITLYKMNKKTPVPNIDLPEVDCTMCSNSGCEIKLRQKETKWTHF